MDIAPLGNYIGRLEHYYNILPTPASQTVHTYGALWIGDSIHLVDSIQIITWIAGSLWLENTPDSGYEWWDTTTVSVIR